MRRFALIPLVFVLSAPAFAQSDLAFAHLALGGTPAYETVLQVINEVEASNPIVIDVFRGGFGAAANGTPLAVRFDGGTPAVSRQITLAPFQEFTTLITVDPGSLKVGWLRVRSTIAGGKISGNLIFRQRSGASLVESVGATSPQRFRSAIVQVDMREAGSEAGLAFANPDGTPVTVTIDLFQGLNRVAVPLKITLQPNQHYAKLMGEMFPSFGSAQGTLVVEADPGRSVPFLALRLDSGHLTGIPVRPLGFVFQYTMTDNAGAVVETGTWMFDLIGFNLVGTGNSDNPPAGPFELTGSWVGISFQFRYRKTIGPGNVGMVIFNGISAGQESTAGSDGRGKAITGKTTIVGADGRDVSLYNFSAYHKFGTAPQ